MALLDHIVATYHRKLFGKMLHPLCIITVGNMETNVVDNKSNKTQYLRSVKCNVKGCEHFKKGVHF